MSPVRGIFFLKPSLISDKEICARSQVGTGRGEVVVCGFGQCLTEQNRTKIGQGRAGQGRMRSGEAAFLGFSPFDILVDRTRVSALPICLISQHTFVWLIFSLHFFLANFFLHQVFNYFFQTFAIISF